MFWVQVVPDDANWASLVRKVNGPGLGVTVPPLLACVLSRRAQRDELSVVIRDLRQEYAASRDRLWDYVEEMWNPKTVRRQISLLAKLEKASAAMFNSAFPERFTFLETAWSVTADLAQQKTMGAVEQLGKAAVAWNESKAHAKEWPGRRCRTPVSTLATQNRLLRTAQTITL